jgi:putative acyl-CoA dehydrogenase
MPSTHEVTNQPPARLGTNTYAEDAALRDAVVREGAAWADDDLRALGAMAGSAEWLEHGRAANAHPPELLTHDRYGHRADEVRYHPSYHQLMTAAVANGLHAAPWAEPRPGAHVARAAKSIVWSRVDAGHMCPMSMTYAVVPSLRLQPDVAAQWEPRALSATYDPAFRPAEEKAGATFGMAMTEKQGGSDVRANSTRAQPVGAGGPGAEYLLTGHKWFCSAPMSDAFLVLAQAPGGLSCFLVPRFTPDGARNAFRLERLKDKLGNRSNASSEVELEQTWGRMVGEEGRGVATIIEMVAHTRLDCAVGAAAGMRQGVVEAVHHCTHRAAFGRALVEQPLMRAVLADLVVESEAATALSLRLARSFDQKGDDEHERLLARLAMPVAKYWLCKRAPAHAAEALECLGGAGYVEESGLPRLFRESPLNGIWEGSGNVQCLDVLRAMTRAPESVEAYLAEVAPAEAADTRLADAATALRKELTELSEATARRTVERMALVLQAALLVRDGDPAVADAFCATRLAGDGGLAFGTLPPHADTTAILARALTD